MSHDPHDNHHPKHLAHHFDSMTQQYESGKLGMWVFLATELLMFGGLFVAYAIYRSNNAEVYMYAHQALDTTMGAINTVILLVSSFTMAWAVRAAQMGKKGLLVTLLVLTFFGGCGFMVVKTFEYSGKYAHGLWVGPTNAFFYESGLAHKETGGLEEGIDYIAHHSKSHAEESASHDEQAVEPEVIAVADGVDRSTIALAAIGPIGTTAIAINNPAELGYNSYSYPTFDELSANDKKRTHIFFQIYYCMTGLHMLHVLIGMAVLFWLVHLAGNSRVKAFVPPAAPLLVGLYLLFLWWKIDLAWIALPLVQVSWTLGVGVLLVVLAAVWAGVRFTKARHRDVEPGLFDSNYFTPVDIGGLYWHLVDLIWIFLFPLLYLIH